MTTFVVVFWTVMSVLLIVYHHFGYPVLLQLLGKKLQLSGRLDSTTDSRDPADLPSITILVPAYNEEAFIAHKIRNLAFLDYPEDKLSIIIASDGSTDSTCQVARNTLREPECVHRNIKVIEYRKNMGKVAILNNLILEIETEILALTDVSALISIDALKVAARHFEDPGIAVVNGSYRLLKPGSAGEKKYWEFQSRLKANEASMGSVIGSHGAFYLLRTSLYQQLPDDTINDDFVIPMQIVQQGYRSIYDDSILALELEQSNPEQDDGRRKRISAGNLQQVIRLRALFAPRFRGTAFTFASGKALRVLVPYLMIIALVGSLVLASTYPLFLIAAVIQVLIYGIYLLLETFDAGDSSKILLALKYLLRGHWNNLKGSAGYIGTVLMRSLRESPAQKLPSKAD